ncbi:MAG: hypothetical protein NUW37_13385 [Planctomycetes bacterium]|nr:hypothetical protein [Planctomycetota bacterium]
MPENPDTIGRANIHRGFQLRSAVLTFVCVLAFAMVPAMILGISLLEQGTDDFTLRAEEYLSGNLNRGSDLFGEGLLVPGDEIPSEAVYAATFGRDGLYEIWIGYATKEPRPIDLFIDGEHLNSYFRSHFPDFKAEDYMQPGLMNAVTGGYGRESLREEMILPAPYPIEAGRRVIALRGRPYIAHLESIRFKRVGDITEGF